MDIQFFDDEIKDIEEIKDMLKKYIYDAGDFYYIENAFKRISKHLVNKCIEFNRIKISNPHLMPPSHIEDHLTKPVINLFDEYFLENGFGYIKKSFLYKIFIKRIEPLVTENDYQIKFKPRKNFEPNVIMYCKIRNLCFGYDYIDNFGNKILKKNIKPKDLYEYFYIGK